MSRAAPPSERKRKLEDGMRGKTARPKKRIRKQRDYHSSEDEEDEAEQRRDFKPVGLDDSEDEEVVVPKTKATPMSKQAASTATDLEGVQSDDSEDNDGDGPDHDDDEEDEEDEGDDEGEHVAHDEEGDDDGSDDSNIDDDPSSNPNKRPITKRNDPSTFSSAMSHILSSSLPRSVQKNAKSDPVLSLPSKSTKPTPHPDDTKDSQLTRKALAHARHQKKIALSKNRTFDATGISDGRAGEVAEEEKRLRKIAQRGVVKLFNAVRAAQVRAEVEARKAKAVGVTGGGIEGGTRKEREEKRGEMSRDEFLRVIGGKDEKEK